MNTLRSLGIFLGAGVLALATSCTPRPEGSSPDMERLKGRLSFWATWVQTHRGELEALRPELCEYSTLRSIAWPRGVRSPLSLYGSLGSTRDGPLPGSGSAGARPGRSARCSEPRLYLDPEIFLAIPDARDARLLARYETWAADGEDPEGELCRQLGGAWYLCSDRGGTARRGPRVPPEVKSYTAAVVPRTMDGRPLLGTGK